MVTLSDIAKNLNLNKTTVSKALNHSSDISRETCERVQNEACRLGYAKSPRKSQKQNAIIGIICPEVASYYYAQIVTLLSKQLQEKGYGHTLMLSGFSNEAEAQQLIQLAQMNVAGIILITEQTVDNDAFRLFSIPTVIIGLNYESNQHDVVSIDEKRGIRSILEHLLNQGHRRIAFVGDHLAAPRMIYLRDFLRANNLTLPEEYIVLSDKRNELCGYDGVHKLLSLSIHPTAVVAGYDTIALGAYRAFCEKGIRIPEDVALVGFDDAPFCRYLPVSLSSVNYDVTAECRIAIAILLSRIQESVTNAVQTVAIVPSLIVRESSTHSISSNEAGE